MRGVTGHELLKLPVRLHGIELARPIDLVVDISGRRAVGLELLCGDRAHRFLPLGAANVGTGEISLDSALAVVDDTAYYLERGRRLHDLRGAAVTRDGRQEGPLEDVVLEGEGAIVQLVVDGGRRLPLGPGVTVGPPPAARSAA